MTDNAFLEMLKDPLQRVEFIDTILGSKWIFKKTENMRTVTKFVIYMLLCPIILPMMLILLVVMNI
jgi:hypothetical protein